MHDELVLIDQSQLCERLRELDASDVQSPARLALELLNGLRQTPGTSSAFQSTRSRVLDTTYFLAASIERAKGSIQAAIQSGHTPVDDGRHADSIIS